MHQILAKQSWVVKDRLYELNLQAVPPVYILRSRQLFYFDESVGYEREIKYCRNQNTVFVDEMKGPQRLGHIVFRNGQLFVEKEQTTIVDGKGELEAIEARVEELQSQIEKAKTPYETEQLQNRLAKFVGGVAIVHVGGNTETEMLEKKDRVDDALHATKAALDEGVVPGGGVALLYASNGIKADSIGAQIVISACSRPFSQILINAGYTDVKTQILADQLCNSGNDAWAGIDVDSGNVVNFREKGVIDPTKVSRLALENAASVAGTVLLTECTLTQDKQSIEEKLKILQDSAQNAAGLAGQY